MLLEYTSFGKPFFYYDLVVDITLTLCYLHSLLIRTKNTKEFLIGAFFSLNGWFFFYAFFGCLS